MALGTTLFLCVLCHRKRFRTATLFSLPPTFSLHPYDDDSSNGNRGFQPDICTGGAVPPLVEARAYGLAGVFRQRRMPTRAGESVWLVFGLRRGFHWGSRIHTALHCRGNKYFRQVRKRAVAQPSYAANDMARCSIHRAVKIRRVLCCKKLLPVVFSLNRSDFLVRCTHNRRSQTSQSAVYGVSYIRATGRVYSDVS